MAINLARTVLNNHNVVWGSTPYDFGAVDKVGLDVTIVTKPIKVGSVGDVPLGDRVVALALIVSFEAREVDLTFLQKVSPWWSSGPIPLLPAAVHQDMYSYAQLLTLHPTDQGATVTQDLSLIRAVPMLKKRDRDGVNDSKDNVQFVCYPERATLPARNYGYWGAPPA